MSSTQITPQQALLSTIYKQSWHPVASTKYIINRGPNRPKDVTFVTKGSNKTPKTRYEEACLNTTNYSSRNTAQAYRRVPIATGPQLPRETSFTIFTTDTNNPDLNALSFSPSSLSTWKRQLKTCIESNARGDGSKNERKSTAERDRGKTLKERLLSARYQQSCASDSSVKSYKVLNYQNSTLASICVQGKDPPTKKRSGSRPRASSTGSFTSLADRREDLPVSSSKGITSHGKDDISTTQAPSSGLTMSRCCSSSTSETELETMEDEDALPDDVFDRNLNENDEELLRNTSELDRLTSKDDLIPNFDFLNLKFSQDSDDADSDNESDISKQEISSEEDDEGIAPNPQESDKSNKLFVQKFRELYKNENKSTSIRRVDDNLRNCKKKKLEKSSPVAVNSKFKPENCIENFEFATVFPKEFEKYNLKELSTLPHDMNWRNFVRLSDLHSDDQSKSKASYVAKQRLARSPKVAQERNRMEALVDRLLAMEKLQALTKQWEVMSRYHVTHVRAAAAKLKTQNNRTVSTASQAQKPNNPDTESISNPRSLTRRRSSASISSARLAWANEISQGDQNILKEANRSGNFSAVLDDWTTKNRSSKSAVDQGRRLYDCSRLTRRWRSRYMHPRFYEYHWSERTKEDKNRTAIFWGGRSRSCSTCREKWKKLNASTAQERRRRPSTASVPYSQNSFYQNGTDRSTYRPLSQQTYQSQSLATAFPMTSSSNQRHALAQNDKTSGTRKEERVSATTRMLTATDENFRNQNQPSFFTSAFRISSLSIAKR